MHIYNKKHIYKPKQAVCVAVVFQNVKYDSMIHSVPFCSFSSSLIILVLAFFVSPF